jgi:Spy/CpxP family protein refolding chaperone
MKMGWKTGIIAAAILAVAGLTVTGATGGAKAGAGKRALASVGERRPVKFLAWWLDLTAKQTTQIEGILAQAKTDSLPADLATAAAKKALHDDVINGATDLKIRAAAAVLGQSIGTEAVLRAKTLTAIKGVLNAEQLKEFDKILTKLPRFALRLEGRVGAQAGEPNAPAATE